MTLDEVVSCVAFACITVVLVLAALAAVVVLVKRLKEELGFLVQFYVSVCGIMMLAAAFVVCLVKMVRRIIDRMRGNRKRKEDAE